MFKKEAREIFKKIQKKNENTFEKRGNLFAHEKVLPQDKGGEKHFLFFQKKKKVDQKNTFFFRKGLSKEHFFFVRKGLSKEHMFLFSVFFFLVYLFFAPKKN